MRIICPGCEAQYEVPDEVIPDEGRDVQCSNCGTTWLFETPDQPVPADDDDRTSRQEDNEDNAENAFVAAVPRRELDPKVASILRAEAERETAARAADSRPAPLEVQPDLGLTEGTPQRRPPEGGVGSAGGKPAKSPARRRPDPAQAGNMTVAAAAAAGSRRDRLPDIEEINSTLRSTGDREMAGDDLDAVAQNRSRGRRGFGLGLLFAVLIFGLCLLVYQFAPQIAEAVPQSDPWLSSYVTWVDETRILLDAKVRQALDWLDAQAAASGG